MTRTADEEPGLSREAHVTAGGLGTLTAAIPGSAVLTPACEDGDALAAPDFEPDSPERTNLITPGTYGTRLLLTGHVYGEPGRPLPRVLLDFWHADYLGRYDLTGFRLRGHQFTSETGAFALSTVVPGLYPDRTRHLHLRVRHADGPLLTTQLFFPHEPRNQTDPKFHPDLVMTVQTGPTGRIATFDIVLPT
ncbi:dioxygenase family protein [Streptosporangium soli]|nr:dioxygenase [Streptosporangium sp. KLBMP 9127]